MLPERHLAECCPLLSVVSLVFDVDRPPSVRVGEPLLGLALRLVALRLGHVVSSPAQLGLEIGISAAVGLPQSFVDDLHVSGRSHDPTVGISQLDPCQFDGGIRSFEVDV